MLIINIGRLVTMEPAPDREGRLGVIVRAALWMDGEKIAWLGPASDLPVAAKRQLATALDAEGGVVMPGLVDSHTHIVHAGSRPQEFVQRARGMSYLEIAKAGGGIMSTVRDTRAEPKEKLLQSAMGRAWEALRGGVTTIEIKSGYGLTTDDECKILQVVRELATQVPIHCVATFLGAHTIPEECRDNRNAYVERVITEMLPRVAAEKLAEFCDVFVEEGAFTADEARRIVGAARELGLFGKLHVDQFADNGGAALAAELAVTSADHLDYISEAGIAALRKKNIVAGILPAASFYTGRGHYPPAKKLIDAGVPVAISTDYNPGTAPTLDLFFCATIAVTQMGLDPDDALIGITRVGAQALRREGRIGSLAIDKQADVIVLGCTNEYYPLYRFACNAVRTVISKGEIVWDLSS